MTEAPLSIDEEQRRAVYVEDEVARLLMPITAYVLDWTRSSIRNCFARAITRSRILVKIGVSPQPPLDELLIESINMQIMEAERLGIKMARDVHRVSVWKLMKMISKKAFSSDSVKRVFIEYNGINGVGITERKKHRTAIGTGVILPSSVGVSLRHSIARETIVRVSKSIPMQEMIAVLREIVENGTSRKWLVITIDADAIESEGLTHLLEVLLDSVSMSRNMVVLVRGYPRHGFYDWLASTVIRHGDSVTFLDGSENIRSNFVDMVDATLQALEKCVKLEHVLIRAGYDALFRKLLEAASGLKSFRFLWRVEIATASVVGTGVTGVFAAPQLAVLTALYAAEGLDEPMAQALRVVLSNALCRELYREDLPDFLATLISAMSGTDAGSSKNVVTLLGEVARLQASMGLMIVTSKEYMYAALDGEVPPATVDRVLNALERLGMINLLRHPSGRTSIVITAPQALRFVSTVTRLRIGEIENEIVPLTELGGDEVKDVLRTVLPVSIQGLEPGELLDIASSLAVLDPRYRG